MKKRISQVTCVLALIQLSACVGYRGADDDRVEQVANPLGVLSSQPERTFVVDGTVNALVVSGNNAYLGGSFGYIGQRSGPWVALASTSGARDKSFPELGGGFVHAVIADGAGGWFVAGDFRRAGSVRLRGITHIRADRSVDAAFLPIVNSDVRALARYGQTLYLAGSFTTVNGILRERLAAVDATTGALTPFHPVVKGLGNSIRALAVSADGATVYLGGSFNSVAGADRLNLAALDTASAAALPWPSPTNGPVDALLLSGTALYVGGSFTATGDVFRKGLAAVNVPSGTVLPFDPDSGPVRAFALDGTTLYIGGRFVSVAGQPRAAVAAVNAESGALLPWSIPNATAGEVSALVVQDGALYVGGAFGSIALEPRRHLAAFDTTTGALLSGWKADASAPVRVLAADPSAPGFVFAGGELTSVGGSLRSNLAAIDVTSRRATAFAPVVDGTVNALAIASATGAAGGASEQLYVGGSFSTANGQARARIAAFELPSADLSSFSATPDDSVFALAVNGSTLFAGGAFRSVAGQNRGRLVAFDRASGALLPWAATANGPVNALLLAETTLYVGGSFSSLNGRRAGAAALDASSAALLPWNPNVSGVVQALASNGATLFLGGSFSTVGGLRRNQLAAVSAVTGIPRTEFDAPVGGTVRTLALDGSNLYVGGDFASVSGLARPYLAAVDTTTSAPTAWASQPDGPVNALARSAIALEVGGAFRSLSRIDQSGLAQLSETP